MAQKSAIILFLLAVWLKPSFAQTNVSIAKLWYGEVLRKDEGLFYLQSIIIDNYAQHKHGSFSFILLGKNLQKAYSIQTETLALGQHPDRVWKLRVDDYQIMKLQYIDSQGEMWLWKGPYRYPILVRSQSLSNSGIWYLVQLKQKKMLSILLKSTKNVFQPEKSQGSIARIINSQNAQEEVNLSLASYKRKDEIRAAYHSNRTIGMYYKVNLFKQNQFAAAVMQVIQANDPDLRSCYTEFLERGLLEEGTISYTVVVSKQSRSIKTLKIKKSEIHDEKFTECLYYKLKSFSFPVNESIAGEVSFIFQANAS